MDKRQLACHAVGVTKLNFGCGHRYATGWVNIDFHPAPPEVKRVNLLRRLPFAEGAFEITSRQSKLTPLISDVITGKKYNR